jgi:3-oxoadipate enol-lactonase
MFFAHELPAPQQWSFTCEKAQQIMQPVLAVLGAKSKEMGQIWRERHELLLSWLPDVEAFILPNATHLLEVENPRGLAEGLAAFLAHHPIHANA